MNKPRTPFVETEALLRALDGLDGDIDTENALVEYLTENCLRNELAALARACEHLRWACRTATRALTERT